MVTWLKGFLTKLLLGPYVGSLVRHGLTALGAILIAKGIVDAEQANTWVEATMVLVPGIVSWLAGQLSSFAAKRQPDQLYGFGSRY